jgi:ABC-2 type transport system ATP-binding protein
MLQRVGIAQALVNDPDLVVLDEPMSGLDPVGRKEVRDLILRLKESGKTVLFSSHILPDAEMLCDRVGMIMKGRLVASGPVSQLVDQAATHSVELVAEQLTPDGLDHLRPLADKLVVQGTRVFAALRHPRDVAPALEIIRASKASLISLTPHKASLEDLFIGLVQPGERAR